MDKIKWNKETKSFSTRLNHYVVIGIQYKPTYGREVKSWEISGESKQDAKDNLKKQLSEEGITITDAVVFEGDFKYGNLTPDMEKVWDKLERKLRTN